MKAEDMPTTSPARLASARAYKEKHKERLKEQQRAYDANPERQAKKREHMKRLRPRYRARQIESDKKRDPVKTGARALIRNLIYEGRLVRGSCVFCDDPNTHGHHEDYSQPTRIVWLCQKHHVDVHAGRISVSQDQIVDVRPHGRRARRRKVEVIAARRVASHGRDSKWKRANE
ncbi:hypothetical protein [Nitrospira sp. BLG_2]|uniref:hypothetical protein n=1 Tax=Nitrospira sp. BLG_2 TaxID=3397507 RepID=UPI003B999966